MNDNQELINLIVEELQSNDIDRIIKLINYLKSNDLWLFFNINYYLKRRIEEIVINKSYNTFKILLLNNYQYDRLFVNSLSISYFLDEEVLRFYLKKEFNNDNYNAFIEIVIKEVINIPSISSFDYLLDNIISYLSNHIVEKDYDNYKDIGNRICSELRNNSNFDDIIKKLTFLNNMQKVLGTDYYLLIKTMNIYYNIFHINNKENNLLKILENKIMELCSKYIEKSKLKLKNNLKKSNDNWLNLFFESNNNLIKEEIIDKIKISDVVNIINSFLKRFRVKKVNFNEIENDVRLFINRNNIIWILLLLKLNDNELLTSNGVLKYDIVNLICNMNLLKEIVSFELLNISDFKMMELLNNISEYASLESILIIGIDTISKLDDREIFTEIHNDNIVDIASLLVTEMVKRNSKTVPYVNGNYYNYYYSIYDSLDETILTSGVDTNACFRIGGFTNDFLQYCILNKNGFVIKITNKNGELLGRASGFRNGNCIYLNQLRTIYDMTHKVKNNDYEKKEIINTLVKACEDIIMTSNKNDEEDSKIDYAFISQTFAFKNVSSNISYEVLAKIGFTPLVNFSKDWQDFIHNTKYLFENYKKNYFSTEYGKSPIICLAASKPISDLQPEDIIKKDCPAIYKRERNKIIITKDIDKILLRKINRIKGIDAYFNNKDILPLFMPGDLLYIVGDNWYIICNDNKIIDSCVLEFDLDAKKEYKVIKHTLLKANFKNDSIKKILKK